MSLPEFFLRCVPCDRPRPIDGPCAGCGQEPRRIGGVLDALQEEEELKEAAAPVSAFYNRSPFPGYAPDEDAASLLDRAGSNPFAAALDRIIDPKARVLDCGCGTGQIPVFLALRAKRRTVVGVDATIGQLQAAEGFRDRVGIPNLHLIRGDLFDLPVVPRAFDFVVSRGVVHHTYDPAGAIRSVAGAVAPGGILVLGYYDGVGRMPHRARRVLSKVVGRPIAALDPILKRPDLSDEKKENWIQDQYYHPVEKNLSLAYVKQAFEDAGLTWVRSIPPLAPGEGLLDPTPSPGFPGRVALRLGWMMRGFGDEDAGLVCVVARRPED